MHLTTRRLILREPQEADAQRMVQLANDLEVSRYLAKLPYPYRLKDAQDYIRICEQRAEQNPQDRYNLAIVLDESLIGMIGLSDVDNWNGSAELGFWLGIAYHRQGYMSEATQAMICFAFEELGLRRLNASACKPNIASQELLKKIGFTFEGINREAIRPLATGDVHDSYMFGLLSKEWSKVS